MYTIHALLTQNISLDSSYRSTAHIKYVRINQNIGFHSQPQTCNTHIGNMAAKPFKTILEVLFQPNRKI